MFFKAFPAPLFEAEVVMPWQRGESLVWPRKLGTLFIHVSACRCRAGMRNRATGGSEGGTSNEEAQAISFFSQEQIDI